MSFNQFLSVTVVIGSALASNLWSQDTAAKPKQDSTKEAKSKEKTVLPKIADEPRAIDPSAILPKNLAAKATKDFSNSSLREVVAWLQDEQKMVVLVDKNALSKIGISPAEPVLDRLNQAPIYLLLNRLESMGLGWYYDDEVLYITTLKVAAERTTTLPYNVSDLLDAGYKMDDLISAITNTLSPDTWEEVGGIGTLNSLGDVLFIRHAHKQQREVHALLQALRKHGRQTFLNDPPQHQQVRARLGANVTVNFAETPLEAAIQQLAAGSGSDIRLDRPALREARIREREPVTLKLADRKLETVLQALVLDLDMTWVLRDGVLWITTPKVSEAFLRTAVYDVRDLCRDTLESDALVEAIVSQSNPDSWSEVGGVGEIEAAKPGTLVVTHQEQVHQQVLHLLETYRSALRASKPRNRGDADLKEIVTVYYGLHTKVAKDLSELLPSMVSPDTWKKPGGNDNKSGTVFVVASDPELMHKALPQGAKTGPINWNDRSVMIIRQSRGVHKEIPEVIQRVRSGDTPVGQMGGGGFGGGFFAIPDRKSVKAK